MRGGSILAGLLAFLSLATVQPQICVAADYMISVETDKSTYAYGEPIVITVKLNKEGDEPVYYASRFSYARFPDGYYVIRTVKRPFDNTIAGQGSLHATFPGSSVNGYYLHSLVPGHAATGIASAVNPQDLYSQTTLLPGKYRIEATVQISTVSGGSPVPVTASSAVIQVK